MGACDERDTHKSWDCIKSSVEGCDWAYAAFLLQDSDEGVIVVELAPG